MSNIYHLNCTRIISPINDNVCRHCLLLQEGDKLMLIDTRIGPLDVQKRPKQELKTTHSASLQWKKSKKIVLEHPNIEIFGYHDIEEFDSPNP